MPVLKFRQERARDRTAPGERLDSESCFLKDAFRLRKDVGVLVVLRKELELGLFSASTASFDAPPPSAMSSVMSPGSGELPRRTIGNNAPDILN